MRQCAYCVGNGKRKIKHLKVQHNIIAVNELRAASVYNKRYRHMVIALKVELESCVARTCR